MNQFASNRIKLLLEESGLLSTNNNLPRLVSDYNFSNETILITGGAGTIGSGITRQLLNCKYKNIILVDNAESPLYYLQKEFEQHNTHNIHFVLADIRHESSMQCLFDKYQPTIIFHTAAYKHVPLMEANPYEAIRLNILATKSLAELAILHKARKFIFISTDKAVNPISVMGMTKYIAEQYLNYLNIKSETLLLIARFGNVLGSNGSLIPLFVKQIESGKPLTITSREVSRYFINIDKACELILKIASLEKLDFNVFTFKMGKPIKIIDLAKTFISAYYKTSKDIIKIEIIGLRPGEKLHEDIVSKDEELKSTVHQDIFLVVPKRNLKVVDLNSEALKEVTPYKKASEIKSILAAYI